MVLVISPWPKASKNVVSNLDHLFVILYYLIMVFVGYFNILFCFCFFFLSFTFARSSSLLMLHDNSIVFLN